MSDPTPASRTYRVRVDDVNYGGHLGNERALLIFQDARIGFLQGLGMSEREIAPDTGMILVEATVRYLEEIFFDDLLDTCVAVVNLKRSSFTLTYRTTRQSDGAPVLEGATVMLPFDYAKRRVRRLPHHVRTALAPFLSGGEES